MNIYAYKGNKELGQEELGSFNKLMFSDLKSKWGILRRCRQAFKGNDFRVYSYSNFYDDKTFKEILH